MVGVGGPRGDTGFVMGTAVETLLVDGDDIVPFGDDSGSSSISSSLLGGVTGRGRGGALRPPLGSN